MSWDEWNGVLDGAPEVFNSADTYYCAVAKLSETQFLICYRDQGTSGYGRAMVATVSGTDLSFGSATTFEFSELHDIDVAAISSTVAVACYRGGDGKAYACKLTVSGTSVSAGTPVKIDDNSCYTFSCAWLSGSYVLVAYNDTTATRGRARVLTVGSSITVGSTTNINSSAAPYLSACALSSSEAVVVYRDGTSGYLTAALLGISGTTVSVQDTESFTGNTSYTNSVCALSSSKALVCYRATAGGGAASVLSVSGSALSVGTAEAFESGGISQVIVRAPSETEALACYRDVDNSNHGTGCALTVSGTSISAGTPVVFEAAAVENIGLTALSATEAAAAYRDVGNSGKGTALVFSAAELLAQEGFRFVNDDGDEDASTFAAGQDTNVNMAAGGAGRIRILLDASGDVDAAQYQLEFRYKAPAGSFGAWGKVKSVVTDGGVVVTDDGATVYD